MRGGVGEGRDGWEVIADDTGSSTPHHVTVQVCGHQHPEALLAQSCSHVFGVTNSLLDNAEVLQGARGGGGRKEGGEVN